MVVDVWNYIMIKVRLRQLAHSDGETKKLSPLYILPAYVNIRKT